MNLSINPTSELKVILQNIPASVFLLSKDGKILYTNKFTNRSESPESGSYINLNIGDILSCERAIHNGGCQKSSECKNCFIQNTIIETINSELPIPKREGYVSWKRNGNTEEHFVSISTQILNIHHEFRILLTIDDITDRKQVETELLESKQYLYTIFNASQSGILLVKADTHEVVEINSTACMLLGITPEEIIGQQCSHFFCHDGKNYCCKNESHEYIENMEGIVIRKDETKIPILRTVRKIELENIPCLLETFVDITSQKEQQNYLKATLDESEKLNKLMLGREMQILKLKCEINELLIKTNQPARYNFTGIDDGV